MGSYNDFFKCFLSKSKEISKKSLYLVNILMRAPLTYYIVCNLLMSLGYFIFYGSIKIKIIIKFA